MNQADINRKIRAFKNWDIADAQISLWSFRKRKNKNQVSYTSKWVDTDLSISSTLTELFIGYQNTIDEGVAYNLLHENAENQFMLIESNLTSVDLLTNLCDRIKENFQAKDVRDLDNSSGYLLKIEHNGNVAYAIKKTEESWKSKKAGGFINSFFENEELTIIEDRTFKLAKKFDMIIFNDTVLIENKKIFESLLDYNQDFKASFDVLVQSPSFANLFTSTTNIISHVGSNDLQLRRMLVIQQKGFYLDPQFMNNVFAKNASDGWNLQYDPNRKLIPTPDTIKDIITILLNHRLKSELTGDTFDVPSTIQVI